MDAKAEFIEIYKKNIKREGADKLLQWLESSDFFTCPASTKFHSNFAGGLVEHSVKVYHRLERLVAMEKLSISAESIAVVALLHDVCKADTYKIEMRNVKRDGEWVKEPYYTVDDPLPYGHGEKSVYIISSFMKLTRDEAMAINWHMGPYDARNANNSYVLSDAFRKFPLTLIMFLADISSSYLDETVKK